MRSCRLGGSHTLMPSSLLPVQDQSPGTAHDLSDRRGSCRTAVVARGVARSARESAEERGLGASAKRATRRAVSL